jgi:hypothetical protein
MADGDYTTFYPAFQSDAGARENYERAGHDLADAPEKSA